LRARIGRDSGAYPLARQRGFTLIEILVALAIGMIILLSLTVLLSRSSNNQQELERTVRLLESARFALDTMAEDVMHAGFYSDFNPRALGPEYQMPGPCVSSLDPQDHGWKTGEDPVEMPVPIQGLAAGSGPNCLSDRMGGTEGFMVRRAETSPTLPRSMATANNLYVQVSRCRGLPDPDPFPILVMPGPAANFTLRQPNCASLNDAVRRVLQRTYYIASCNDCANGDGIPTLRRVEFEGGVRRNVAIAEGVEDLQVEYGLDTNNDGQPDRFVTLGSNVIGGTEAVGGTAPDVWENVVAVRLHLLVRSTQASPGHVDPRTYTLGPDVTVGPLTDGFKRMVLTSTVRLHNVGGRLE
jgi:type IV pilus assembly protein PilW